MRDLCRRDVVRLLSFEIQHAWCLLKYMRDVMKINIAALTQDEQSYICVLGPVDNLKTSQELSMWRSPALEHNDLIRGDGDTHLPEDRSRGWPSFFKVHPKHVRFTLPGTLKVSVFINAPTKMRSEGAVQYRGEKHRKRLEKHMQKIQSWYLPWQWYPSHVQWQW